MPQSKNYTLKTVRGLCIRWLKQMNLSKLDVDLVDDFVKLAVREVFQLNSDAIFKLYGETFTLTDAASAFNVTSIQTGVFTHSTKNILKAAHGLTNNDVGKRIIFGRSITATGLVSYVTSAVILSISDADNFIVSHSPGYNIPGGGATNTLFYSVLPFTASTYYDISALNINQIRKITDSLNGEVIEVDDARDFENLSKYPQKQNKVYFFNHGDRIEIYKGANVVNLGTMTLYYYAMPADPSTENDYLDIPDDLMPQVVQKTQNFIISHLKRNSSQESSPMVEQKAGGSRVTRINQEKELAVKK